LLGTNLTLTGPINTNSGTVWLQGVVHHPDAVICPIPAGGFRVAIDYPKNLLQIDELSPGGQPPVPQLLIHIQATGNLSGISASNIFSWQSYRHLVGVLHAYVYTNGGIIETNIGTNNVIPSKGQMPPSSRDNAKTNGSPVRP
jgi:hypothetical protein